ncbi:MAG: DUF481 domain-containing protein [Fimbriimonadaceae bacterium]|nr:DUF481 domain-containing protein [Chitinophagales bacterium]
MKKILLIAGMLLIMHRGLRSQVINIESYRIRTDTSGWAGSADVSLYLAKYDEPILTFLTNLQLQYKEGKSLFLMLTDLASVQTDEEKFVSSGFQHFRYNYKITDRFVWEAFVQGQYNAPLAIDWRFLTGTGPRFKLVGTDKFRMYIAALYMFELEKNTGIEDPINANRLSSYISFTLETNENYTLTSTTYYQPNFADFADYRISTALNLKTYFGKYGYMKLKYSLLDDKAPAEGVPETTYNLSGGLGFEF